MVTNRERLGSFGKSGYITDFDDNVQPGNLFAIVDMEGTQYCFNINDLSELN